MPDPYAMAPFIDPAGLLTFWQREYLEGYISQGGGTVKWLRGREGSGKSRFLAALSERALELRYLTAHADAGSGSLGRFDDFYHAMMAQVSIDDIAQAVARAAAHRIGAASWHPAAGTTVEEYLREEGRPSTAIQDDLARSLDFLYENRNVDAPVAAAARRLAMPYVAQSESALRQADTAARWLRGERLRAGERRQTGIYLALDRYSARDVLRSILHLLQLIHIPGMIWTVDRLETLLAKRGVQALGSLSGESSLPSVHYTALRRLDAYEGIRELIDEGGGLPGLMIVYAGRPEVFEDERAGLVTYPALAMRVQTEIDADAINLYNDVQDLDRLWQSRWPEHQEALIEAYAADGGLETLDLSGVLSSTSVSPVRRLVEWLMSHSAGREEEAHA